MIPILTVGAYAFGAEGTMLYLQWQPWRLYGKGKQNTWQPWSLYSLWIVTVGIFWDISSLWKLSAYFPTRRDQKSNHFHFVDENPIEISDIDQVINNHLTDDHNEGSAMLTLDSCETGVGSPSTYSALQCPQTVKGKP